jgi:hypothetical protein
MEGGRSYHRSGWHNRPCSARLASGRIMGAMVRHDVPEGKL